MRVLVCGGRDFTDREFLYEMLDLLHERYKFTRVIHGGARGADSMAGDWAAVNHIAFNVFVADWDRHGNNAGPIRNRQMLNDGKPQLVIAFAGGRGTKNMTHIARKAFVNVLHFQ